MFKPDLQYLINEQGEKTAVIIPIKEWVALQEQLKEFEESRIMEVDLEQALEEVGAIKAGEIKKQSLEDFLNEC